MDVAGTKGVSVTDATDVFVIIKVSIGGMGVDVRVQVMDVIIDKIGKRSLRLMRGMRSPFGILYPKNRKFRATHKNKYPRPGTGIV